MTHQMTVEEYPYFKEKFWEWFDSLPVSEKQEFWYFKVDMAETNFYFTQYDVD